jgi:hypothetical protein
VNCLYEYIPCLHKEYTDSLFTNWKWDGYVLLMYYTVDYKRTLSFICNMAKQSYSLTYTVFKIYTVAVLLLTKTCCGLRSISSQLASPVSSAFRPCSSSCASQNDSSASLMTEISYHTHNQSNVQILLLLCGWSVSMLKWIWCLCLCHKLYFTTTFKSTFI